MSEPRSDFFSRWSRRKALQQEETDQLTINEGAAQEDQLPVVTEEEEAPALTDDDMPPLETLGEDDSYSDFFFTRGKRKTTQGCAAPTVSRRWF